MTSLNAEIVDLEAYRVRRADARADYNGDSELSPAYRPTGAMSFLIPAVFFVFSPTWVFSPQLADVQWRGGHDGR